MLWARKSYGARNGGLGSCMQRLEWLGWPEAEDWNHLEASSLRHLAPGLGLAWRRGSAGMFKQSACTWHMDWVLRSLPRANITPHRSSCGVTELHTSCSVPATMLTDWGGYKPPDVKGGSRMQPLQGRRVKDTATFLFLNTALKKGNIQVFFCLQRSEAPRREWVEEVPLFGASVDQIRNSRHD